MTDLERVDAGFREKFAEYGRTLDCIHCGLCLPACPTYEVTGRESDSPRGRIYLMRGYAEGQIEISAEARLHLDQCIVCRGCETVCPSGIHMGEMMESFRDEFRRNGGSRLQGVLLRAVLMGILPHRERIAALTDLLYYFDRTGLRKLCLALARRFWPGLASLDSLLPPLSPPGDRRIDLDAASAGGTFRARGKPRVRVALFLGCIASEWCVSTHRATIEVLRQNGCDVVVPMNQTCCGALHRHAGYLDDAAELFARNVEAFGSSQVDVVVVNAAGCGSSLKEPPRGVPGGLGVPVRDICEFLGEIGLVEPRHPIPLRVTHHPPCHLVHAQKVSSSTVEDLLQKIPGLTLVPLPRADLCCGAGGVFNLLHPEMAQPLQREKVEAILSTGAEIVATGNPGCLFQIRAGLGKNGVEVLHPVELLHRAYSM